MRNWLLCLFGTLALGASAQESKIYKVNSIEDNKEELIRDTYRYPQFAAGVVHFKNGAATKARLNYHRFYDQVLFISPKGDTLALVDPGSYKYIAIGADTFYVQEEGYAERLTHYGGVNLLRKYIIEVAGREKKGGYGTYSSTTAVESRSQYTGEDGRLVPLQVDENTIYKGKSLYFLSDAFNNIFPATKKNFYNLFSKQEKRLKEYLDTHKVNFFHEQDLLQLMAYLQEDKE